MAGYTHLQHEAFNGDVTHFSTLTDSTAPSEESWRPTQLQIHKGKATLLGRTASGMGLIILYMIKEALYMIFTVILQIYCSAEQR
jgi:hypothetical protein